MRVALTLLALSTIAACDSTGGDEPPVDSCGFSCDDGNFCTEDRCDDTSGQCIHVPRDAANACTQDRHCDDQDPCTTDSCAVDECGLSRCRHDLLIGCRSCASSNTCDDNNPCTNEVCGGDLLCRYTDEPDCDSHCRMWSGFNFYTPGVAIAGDITLYGRIEPRGGTSCGTACDCAADVMMADDYASVSLSGAEADGAWSCAIAQSCLPPTVVTCDPLEYRREYIVWGLASGNRDRAGAAIPFPGDTAANTDVSFPQGPPATRMQVDGWCLAPTELGLIGAYTGTIELDGEDSRTIAIDFGNASSMQIHQSGDLPAQGAYYELWTGYSVGFYFTLGSRSLRADLYPGKDRLVGRVSDPSQPGSTDAGAKPGDVPAPPGNEFGKRIGTMTLVLEP